MSNTFTIEHITPETWKKASSDPDRLADFLHEHLDRFRDAREEIMSCIQYALGIQEHRSGFILAAYEGGNGDVVEAGSGNATGGNLLGVTVVCETGMSGYIPENLVVYIAVDASTRGRGIGKTLMEKAIEMADGDLALHVEPDNPAKRLYSRIGFTNKYLEMRFKK